MRDVLAVYSCLTKGVHDARWIMMHVWFFLTSWFATSTTAMEENGTYSDVELFMDLHEETHDK